MATVLLVAREKSEADLIRATLAQGGSPGFELHWTATADEAGRLLDARSFDAVLVDLGGAETSEPEAAGLLEAVLRAASAVPVVAIADACREWRAVRALQAGARDYLVKRSRRPALLERVLQHAIESRRSEQRLDESRARIAELEARAPAGERLGAGLSQTIFEMTTVGIAVSDLQGKIVFSNPALQALFGCGPRELQGLRPADCFHPDSRDEAMAQVEAMLSGASERWSAEVRCVRRDGTAIWVQAHASLVRDVAGRPQCVVAMLEDRTEAHLLEERHRNLLDAAPEAMVAADRQGRIVLANRQVEALFGHPREGLMGKPIGILLPGCDWLALQQPRPLPAPRSAPDGSTRGGEFVCRRADGSEFSAEISFSPLASEEGDLVIAAIRDVTERVRAEQALRQSESRFRAMFEGTSVGISIMNLAGRCLAVNAALQRMLGYSHEEMIGATNDELVHPEDREACARDREELLTGRRDRYEAERRYLRRDGSTAWLRLTSSLVRNADGEPELVVGVCEDLTERRLAREALRERTIQLLSLVGSAANEARSVDEALQLCLTHVCEKLGWQVGHALLPGADGVLAPSELWHVSDRELFASFKAATQAQRFPPGFGIPGRVFESQAPVWLRDLSPEADDPRLAVARGAGLRSVMAFPVKVEREVAAVIEFFSREPVEPELNLLDALRQVGVQLGHGIERKRMETSLAFYALHDSLTSLPNRMLFMDRLRHAIARMDRGAGRVAMLFMDVDGFKEVNDTLGHAVGDRVLVEIASRIRALVRPGDTVARLGGDEFTILCDEVEGPEEARVIGARVIEAMNHPVVIPGGERRLTLSVGIALADRPKAHPDHIIRNADAAMYLAKQTGGNRVEVYDAAMRERARHRRTTGLALRRAIEQAQIRIYYQPGFSLRDGSVTGIEALLRWQHPERGLVAPGEIIPVAEETGQIESLGAWVLEQACLQSVLWRKRFPELPRIGMWVNLSSRQVSSGALAHRLSEILASTGMEPRDLCLEITESVLMDDTESAMHQLQAVRNLGVELSIDDFGTGYSSLSYLKRMPIAQVKLDRIFVEDLGRDLQTTAIVKGVVDLAHALNLAVVAEGVETDRQLEELRALGCDSAQGFLFARPQPAEAIEGLIAVSAVR